MPYLLVYIFIILLLLIAPVIVFMYFSDKHARQQRQLILITRQNNELKNIRTKQRLLNQSINVTYVYPGFTKGIISEYCNLYLGPIENSPIVSKLDIGLKIEIHDGAQVGDSIWYEISQPAETRVNNKGWVKGSSLTKVP